MSETALAPVKEQFETAEQQREAATMGMWIFLATEVLFFGGMFLCYTVYRYNDARAFAEASRQTLVVFGSINTAILLLSSAVMAFAVQAARLNRRGWLSALLSITALLGVAFLTLKGIEYAHEISEGLFPGHAFRFPGAEAKHAEMFFYIYWVTTGMHALHVTIGIFFLALFAGRAWFANAFQNRDTPIELLGLYWHFVDIVWVFLFPLLYLVDRHQ